MSDPPPISGAADMTQGGVRADTLVTRATIDAPWACVGCGYELSGLAAGSRCPECGLEIERSMRGHLLRAQPAEFVERLGRGAVWVQWGLVAYAVSLPLVLVASRHTRSSSSDWALVLAADGTTLLGAAMSAWGWWLLTTPETDGARDRQCRVVIRVVTLVLMGIVLVRGWLGLRGVESWLLGSFVLRGDWKQSLSDILCWASNILLVVRFFASIEWIMALARRVPSALLERQARGLRLAGPLLLVPGVAICGVGPVVSWALYLGLIDNLRWVLKQVRGLMG